MTDSRDLVHAGEGRAHKAVRRMQKMIAVIGAARVAKLLHDAPLSGMNQYAARSRRDGSV